MVFLKNLYAYFYLYCILADDFYNLMTELTIFLTIIFYL